MIADILDVSRIEARRLVLQLQAVDLPMLVTAVVERMAPVTANHPVQVDIDGTVAPTLADPARIEQVLSNLLSNAAKYGDPESDITITVRQHEGSAVVSVTNRGPRVRSDEVAKVFNRFYRTRDTQDGHTPGLGLGLYISKGIIDGHHGQIWVESIPNQTTTFAISLPSAVPSEG